MSILEANRLSAAIALKKAGHISESQKLLEQLLGQNPRHLEAWWLYVDTWPTVTMRIHALELCLRHNPEVEEVKSRLAWLQAEAPQRMTATAKPEARPSDAPQSGPAAVRHPIRKQQPTRNGRFMIFVVLAALLCICVGLPVVTPWLDPEGGRSRQ